MVSSSPPRPRPANAVAAAAIVASSSFYAAYRSHNRRVLSKREVALACDAPERMAPASASATATVPASGSGRRLLSNLNGSGVTVVRGTLGSSGLAAWRKKARDAFDDEGESFSWNSGRAHFCLNRRSTEYAEMALVGRDRDDDGNGDAEAGRDGIGEGEGPSWLGRMLRGRSETKSKETNKGPPPPPSLQDVVKSYFERYGIERYGLTDLQYLDALPDSTNQIWLRDNQFLGLTAIVALCDVRSNGPTELISGSQRPDFSLRRRCRDALLSAEGKNDDNAKDDDVCDSDRVARRRPVVLLGCIDAGDAILYDARILHRGGRGNDAN